MATTWINKKLNSINAGLSNRYPTRSSTPSRAQTSSARLSSLYRYYQTRGSQGIAAVRRFDTYNRSAARGVAGVREVDRMYQPTRPAGVQDVRAYETDYERRLQQQQKALGDLAYQQWLKERQTNMLNWYRALQAMYPGYKINLAGRGGWDTTLTPPPSTAGNQYVGGGYPGYDYGDGGGASATLPDWYNSFLNQFAWKI